MSRPVILPTNDIAFKKLFTDSNDTGLLISFLNAMLCDFIDFEITEVSLQDPVQIPDQQTKKTTILDVYCKDSANNNFIVEMQVAPTSWSHERAQHYVSKTFIDQVQKSKSYTQARPVFLIAILCFTMFKEHERYITCHQTLDVVDHKQYLRGCNYIFVELPKFKKLDVQAIKNEAEAWCMFMKNSTKLDLMNNLGQKSLAIKKAIGTLISLNWTDEEWKVYEEIEKIERDNKMAEDYLRKEAQEAGIAIGMEKGKIEGKQEAKVELAKSMLEDGLSLERVAKITGLSIQEIANLKNYN